MLDSFSVGTNQTFQVIEIETIIFDLALRQTLLVKQGLEIPACLALGFDARVEDAACYLESGRPLRGVLVARRRVRADAQQQASAEYGQPHSQHPQKGAHF